MIVNGELVRYLRPEEVSRELRLEGEGGGRSGVAALARLLIHKVTITITAMHCSCTHLPPRHSRPYREVFSSRLTATVPVSALVRRCFVCPPGTDTRHLDVFICEKRYLGVKGGVEVERGAAKGGGKGAAKGKGGRGGKKGNGADKGGKGGADKTVNNGGEGGSAEGAVTNASGRPTRGKRVRYAELDGSSDGGSDDDYEDEGVVMEGDAGVEVEGGEPVFEEAGEGDHPGPSRSRQRRRGQPAAREAPGKRSSW